jgi:DNA-directed RNA polymerase specialized sigma24 family protein
MAIIDPLDAEPDEDQPFQPPSTPSGPFRGERPGYAPSSNPRGLSHDQLDALHNFLATREDNERRLQLLRDERGTPQ